MKMWYAYMMEYYSDVKKNTIIKLSGKLMEQKVSILSKVAQIQESK